MSDHFEYKGYLGSAEVDAENGVLHGRLLFIRDVISYEATTVKALERAFKAAVDDYLTACIEQGDEPDVPCKGSFNVRVGPERHREAALRAKQKGVGLNEYVCLALDEAARAVAMRTVVHRHEVTVVPTGETLKRIGTASQPLNWERISGTGPKH